MLTYNEIYEALRRERYSEQLQPLNKNFISEINNYFKEKKQVAEKDDNLFSDALIKTKKQLENAVSIFKELIVRRKKKILNLAFVASATGISKKDFENLLDFERELFDKLVLSLDNSEKKMAETMNGKQEEKKTHLMVVFKKDTPEFLDLQGEKQGPFKQGDIANLQEEIVKILAEEDTVEKIDN